MKTIKTNFLSLSDVKDIIKLLCKKHNIDYDVNIKSIKNSEEFEIEFKEV